MRSVQNDATYLRRIGHTQQRFSTTRFKIRLKAGLRIYIYTHISILIQIELYVTDDNLEKCIKSLEWC